MPFTFAHPAITMPFWKKKTIPVSALIFGCMSPDFEYFMRFRAASIWSHEGVGIVLFNLPMILLLFILFETVVRPVLYDSFPLWFPYRWDRTGEMPDTFKAWMMVLIMGIAGVCTHLIWDQFTHQGAWVVNHIPVLTQVLHMGTLNIPVYKLCQHGSSILGLSLTIWWIHKHLYVKAENRQQTSVWLFWCSFLALFMMLVTLSAFWVVGGDGLQVVLQLVVPVVSSAIIALILTCLLLFRKARHGQQMK